MTRKIKRRIRKRAVKVKAITRNSHQRNEINSLIMNVMIT
jgi:hypothetical protein